MAMFVARRRQRGQNLVELVLTFPLLLVAVFAIMEVGKAWHAFETVKLAALDGVYTAAAQQGTPDENRIAGENQVKNRLTSANFAPSDINVKIYPQDNLYVADVSLNYRSLFHGVRIPTLAGPITILPDHFVISYKEIKESAVY